MEISEKPNDIKLSFNRSDLINDNEFKLTLDEPIIIPENKEYALNLIFLKGAMFSRIHLDIYFNDIKVLNCGQSVDDHLWFNGYYSNSTENKLPKSIK
jgi:hypothetical protein